MGEGSWQGSETHHKVIHGLAFEERGRNELKEDGGEHC